VSPPASILVLGFGNPGRADDGLGPAFADYVMALGLAQVHAESVYQLQVEDSLELSLADVVIFVDATIEQSCSFDFEPVEPDPNPSFTSHEVSPGGLLAIAKALHKTVPDAYLLTIRGHDFDHFYEGLSAAAARDLEAAATFIQPLLEARDPELFRAACPHPCHG
jgi:hydrogenase maturation protease